ncbi:hypothetical protein [Marinobacter fonticola]|uniref:hypothetical protein n=1 Tax=Marinobacter fonticola TaxID=2603215 RepID=UPI0011E6FEDF|nr:hypothetical protein [Marinobacter fonticola]
MAVISAISRLIPSLVLVAFIGLVAMLSSERAPGDAARIVLPQWPDQNPLDWQAVDRLVARVPLTERGALVVDGRTIAALEEGSRGVALPLTPEQRMRIEFLLNKGLPDAGNGVADLFFRFLQYRAAEQALGTSASPAEHERLQARFFGHQTAHSLFQQQNAMRKGLAEQEAQRQGEPPASGGVR